MADTTQTGAHVFCYGSLMFDAVWARVVAGNYRSAPGLARGLRRRALRGETYPAATREAGADLIGRVFFDVDKADLARLDAFEGEEYRREAVTVELLDAACDPVTADHQAVRPLEGLAPISAGVYLFLQPWRLDSRPWDAARFAREQIDRFIATYAGGPWPVD